MLFEERTTTVLDLPGPCLLAVLRICADDQHSLYSAVRAHSQLHQASVQAINSIDATISHEQQMDGILLYLDRHGRDVDSLRLSNNADGNVESTRATLRQLPANLRLSSLHLQDLDLQLQSGNGFEGVLGAGGSPALNMLCLTNCKLLDGSKGLAAALPQMLDLEHLSVGINTSITGGWLVSSQASVLQQLTYLELSGMEVQGPRPRDGQPALQPLNALTKLLDLRLKPSKRFCMTGSMPVGPCSLTRLELTNCLIEPEALAGKTKMQHVSLVQCNKSGGAPRQMQLLEQLQYMQQLTHLDLDNTLEATLQAVPFAALTASSKLQVLGIHLCTLPADVWKHVFPAGRQLPGLQKLDISYTSQEAATPSVSTFLLSCCLGLQELHLDIETRGRETVASLRGLSRLHTLHLNAAFQPADVLLEVCQLTGLQQLKMSGFDENEGLLLKLTQLKQLTNLSFTRYLNRYAMGIRLNSQAPLACSNKRIDAAADRHAVWRALVMLAFPFGASCCASTSTMATLKLHSRHLQQ